MSGKRRRPYIVRNTSGWRSDETKDKIVQEYVIIGYAATKTEGLQMLAEFNKHPFDVKAAKITFQEVYEQWSAGKFPTISESNVHGYRNYYDSYFTPLMEQLGYSQTPHCTRHTCISLLAEAHVDQTMIKKIVGHAGAMTLTERVYTHLDIKALVDAINQI